jgi:hypothetical protein
MKVRVLVIYGQSHLDVEYHEVESEHIRGAINQVLSSEFWQRQPELVTDVIATVLEAP